MGLSNYIASSRLAQPGVCTSTTRPALPYEGQVIFETNTHRVLVWDNAAWVMIADTDQPPGLQLVSSQDFSTSPLNITGVFSSEFVNYKVLLTYYGSAASNINFQFFSAANTLYSGNNYYRYGWAYAPAGTFANRLAGPGTSVALAAHQNNASQQTSVEMTFWHPNSDSQRKYLYAEWFDASTGDVHRFHIQVVDNLAFTGFRLSPVSGIIAGKIWVYGYRN